MDLIPAGFNGTIRFFIKAITDPISVGNNTQTGISSGTLYKNNQSKINLSNTSHIFRPLFEFQNQFPKYY